MPNTILLIDDDTILCDDIALILREEGYTVYTALNGADGVALAFEHHPDLIISDIHMPKLDGYGVLAEVRKNTETQSIPFIFLTAQGDRESWRKGMSTGADDYIVKPFSIEELVEAIEARLKRQAVLQDEVTRQTTELRLLRQLDAELSYRLDANWVSTIMMDWVLRKTQAHIALMGIIEVEQGELVLQVKEVFGEWVDNKPDINAKLPLSSQFEYVFLNREPLLTGYSPSSIHTPISPDMRSVLCVPISTDAAVLGILVLESRNEDAFDQNDIMFLSQITSRVAIALEHAILFQKLMEEQKRQREMRQVFGRFVAPAIANAIQSNYVDLDGELRNVSVLFCDIRGFTEFSNRHTPKEVVALLNEYLPLVVDAAQVHGGIVNKFGGDSTLVIYGAPVNLEETAYHAVMTALHIQNNVKDLYNSELEGDFLIRLGIGINTGDVIAGAVGPEVRQEYTVIGDTVNLASRIESLNKDYPEYDIFISEYTHEALGERRKEFELKDLGSIPIRGRSLPIQVWAVIGFAS